MRYFWGLKTVVTKAMGGLTLSVIMRVMKSWKTMIGYLSFRGHNDLEAPLTKKGQSGYRLPNRRVSIALKHRQNNYAIPLSAEINTVRETIGNDSPNIFVDNGKLKRMAGGSMKRGGQTHCRILARAAAFTSFQETVSSGYFR